jgi:hypothetical protein
MIEKGMYYRGMIEGLVEAPLFEQVARLLRKFEEFDERLGVISPQVDVSRKIKV